MLNLVSGPVSLSWWWWWLWWIILD